MDRVNYSRWLPIYLADMKNLSQAHSDVNTEFLIGNHAVCWCSQPFAQVWADMALEQSVNLDSKSRGGILGISQNPRSLERWFLSAHDRASVTTALKGMCGMDNYETGTHKDCTQNRITRDEDDITKILTVFDNGLLQHPFRFELIEENEQPTELTNFSTGVIAPAKVSDRLLNAKHLGEQKLMDVTAKQIISHQESFWDPISKLKILTFASMTKTRPVKTADEKFVSVSADRDVFGRLVVAAKSREIDLKEVLSYELSAVPGALAHKDGTLRKSDKSSMMKLLEEYATVPLKLPEVRPSELPTALLIDGMALIQALRTCGKTTFGELSVAYFDHITSSFGKNGCNRVDVIFDTYRELSIKSGERQRRGTSDCLKLNIHGPTTPIPRQWQKYISNANNKINLCQFLVQTWCERGSKTLANDTQLVIGGGLTDNEKTVAIRAGLVEEILLLRCDHEEADTRLLFHAKHAASDNMRIVIQSPNTDVMVLCVHHYHSLGCDQLWFKTGTRDKLRFIPIHSFTQKIGKQLCHSIIGLHALTGCDSTSAFFGVGKKKAWNTFKKDDSHLLLGELRMNEHVPDKLVASCEQFVCKLYLPTVNEEIPVNHLRHFLFCQKRQTDSNLPPTKDSLRLHVERVNYQVMIWIRSLQPKQDLPCPSSCGWVETNGQLQPVLMTDPPAPMGLVELTTCKCRKRACSTPACVCRRNGLACTELCVYMASESCLNSPTMQVDMCSEEEFPE